MSLLDQLESTDSIDVSSKVADMSTPDISSGMDESYMSWYNYVNNTPEFTHILAICLDDVYYRERNVHWNELLEVIDCIAEANFISHSEPNAVSIYNPYRRNENTDKFTKEPSYKYGGPVLKEPHMNGRIRIKLAVEMPQHYSSTKYLNFLVSIRTIFGDDSIVPRDGEFIEVYRREHNNVWRTILPEAMSEASVMMNVIPKFGESNMAYFYKFVDNSKACVLKEDSGWHHSDLPELPDFKLYGFIFERIISHKMLESGPTISHQVDAWLERADNVFKRLNKNNHIQKDKWKRETQATITINNKKYILNTAALKSNEDETSESAFKQKVIFLVGMAAVWALITFLTRLFLL